jgi:hypothetical protein
MAESKTSMPFDEIEYITGEIIYGGRQTALTNLVENEYFVGLFYRTSYRRFGPIMFT